MKFGQRGMIHSQLGVYAIMAFILLTSFQSEAEGPESVSNTYSISLNIVRLIFTLLDSAPSGSLLKAHSQTSSLRVQLSEKHCLSSHLAMTCLPILTEIGLGRADKWSLVWPHQMI